MTYAGATGLVTTKEIGTVNSQSDTDWAGFTASQALDMTYDPRRRPITQKLSSGATAYAMRQTSYNADDSVDCIATRMNPAAYGSLPASACTQGTVGSFGPDRIAKAVYDNAGRVTQIQEGVGTSDAAAERTLTYTNNGLVQTLVDAENNKSTFVYDGFDRASKLQYPSPTKGAGTSSTTDYEQLTYDANSNVTSRRLRDATNIAFTYDNLNRPTLKDLPGTEPSVTYAYDNLDRLTSASQTGNALGFGYDALGRMISETGPEGTIGSGYDLAGRKTSIAYPGATALNIAYAYLATGELDTIKQGTSVLADYAYDNLGNRTGVTFGNGAVQSFGYDAVGRLTSLSNDLAGTTNDLSATFAYNPASQIGSTTRTGGAYAYGGLATVNRNYAANGLNQYTSAGTASFTHDSKGNLTSDGTNAFAYTSENLMKSGPGSSTLAYDPAMRLYQVASTSTTRFAYDGLNMAAEYNASDALQRRYVFDPTTGQPVIWYEGTGTATTNQRYLSQDERGSVISVSDSSGASLAINSYDEYGIPALGNGGRFQYTGLAWLSEVGVQYSRARMYSPTLGRFMQPDPIGYAGDGPNLYAYTLNDPVNFTDPLGTLLVSTPIWASVNGSDWSVIGYRTTWEPDPPSPVGGDLFGGTEIEGGSSSGLAMPAAPPPPQQCSSKPTQLGQIADLADGFSDATAYLSLGSLALGAATSETIVGGVTFGGLSAVLGGLSAVGAGVSATARYFDGNGRAALSAALGGAAGALVPPGMSAALKFETGGERLVAGIVGEGYGKMTSAIVCSQK